MTLYLHQTERTAPHTQSGYSLPEIKLRLSELSWVTLKLSLGRLQSSTAPCGQPYKILLIVVPRILKKHSLLFYSPILAKVRLDLKQLLAPISKSVTSCPTYFQKLSVKTEHWHHEPQVLCSLRGTTEQYQLYWSPFYFYPGNELSIHQYPRENIGKKSSCHKI
jgi:hypothetical protein